MITPVNYVDLYDRLYPELHLHGLTDDNQINLEELNQRYAIIRANQRTMNNAMNAVYAAQQDGSHYRDYMLPFWEIAYSKKFKIGKSEAAAMRYIKGYDPAGLNLDFPESRTAFYANDCGSSLLTDRMEVLLFVDGLLVNPSDYHVHPSQGGFAVYAKETSIQLGMLARIIVIRKFNERGVTFQRMPAAKIAEADAPLNDGTPAAHIGFSLPALGHVHDARYYMLFAKKTGDGYFRPVDADSWNLRVMPGYEVAVAGVVGDYAVPGAYSFTLVDKAEFWKKTFDRTLLRIDPLWKVDLVDNEGMPLPVACAEDVDIWVNGRKLVPNKDYWVEFGSHNAPDEAPRIIFEDVYYGATTWVTIMSGAPTDNISSIDVGFGVLPNQDAVVRFDPRKRNLRLLQNVGMVFSAGYLELAGDGIETVADNLALHFDGLRDATEFSYRARYVFSPEMLDGAMRQSEVPTVLERFARTVGSLQKDRYYSETWYNGDFRQMDDGYEFLNNGKMDYREGAYNLHRGVSDYREKPCSNSICDTSQWDLVEIHRRNHPTPPVPTGIFPDRQRRSFPAMYFHIRDNGYLLGQILGGQPNSLLDPWRQGDRLNFDFRDKDFGPFQPVKLDCRDPNNTYVYQIAPSYPSAEFTVPFGSNGDMRPGKLQMHNGLDIWVRDAEGNLTLDGRDQTHWRTESNFEFDLRGDEYHPVPKKAIYASRAYLDTIMSGDFREGGMTATPEWQADELGNAPMDGRELTYWGVDHTTVVVHNMRDQ